MNKNVTAKLARPQQQPTHRLINQDSGKIDYLTPPDIIAAARQTMGGIDLDPASNEAANVSIKAKKIYTSKDNGLVQPWAGRVWMNHPFSRQANSAWINKLVSEYEAGHVTEACCITFASTSENWFRPLLKRPQCFLVPRTNYLLPDGTVLVGTTKGSAVTYLGTKMASFADAFGHLGEIKVIWTAR